MNHNCRRNLSPSLSCYLMMTHHWSCQTSAVMASSRPHIQPLLPVPVVQPTSSNLLYQPYLFQNLRGFLVKNESSAAVSQMHYCTSSRQTCKVRSHCRESFGRPRTVLCHTMGKLVMLQKFCVTATVLSRLITTCHQPPGTNTVSPGH